jgi:hypothetical protein
MSDRNINWLASFPKSGNTWARAFLRAYQFDAYEPININTIAKISRSESRLRYFKMVSGRTGTFTDEIIDEYRHAVQRLIAGAIGFHQVVKTHNARIVRNGHSLICDEFSRCAIYIVRNPLYVVDSIADHNGLSHTQAVQLLNDSGHTIGTANETLVTQYLTTWSNHVASWVTADKFPVLVIRYEDLVSAPLENFGRMIKFLGWMYDADRVRRAVEFSSFETLKNSESQHGFYELSDKSQSGRFFREGPRASPPNLSPELARALTEQHYDIMSKFGYISLSARAVLSS